MSTPAPPIPVARQSRRRWYVLTFVILLLGIPVGYYFIAGWLRDRELEALYLEMDAEDPHWRWPDLVANLPAPPPDDQNAAVQVLKVRDLLKATPFTQLRWKGKLPLRLPDEQVVALRASLSKLGPGVVKEARKLKDFPEGRFRVEAVENPLDEKTPAIIDMGVLDVMRVLKHDVMLLSADGDIEGAAESCRALLNTVHAIDDAPGLLSSLFRFAGQEMAIDGLERALTHGAISAPRTESLLTALVREDENDGVYKSMRGERAMFHQYYLQVKGGKAPSQYLQTKLASNSRFPRSMAALLPGVFAGSYSDALRAQNDQVSASKLRDNERLAAFAGVATKHANIRNVQYTNGVFAIELPKAQARLRCAITALAAERYRLEHGKWPDGADELVKAGLLKKAYVDPEDGKPLTWKRSPTGIVISANVRAGVSFELTRPVVDRK